MKTTRLLPAAIAVLTLAACRGPQTEPSALVDTSAREANAVSLVQADPTGASATPSAAASDGRQFTPRPVTARPAAPKPARRVAPAPAPKAEPQTLYVETYGAQGKVWGHVTMNGDTGSGTIHDADENTLSVSCTRHGNELYAVDQNSRRYVFRLK